MGKRIRLLLITGILLMSGCTYAAELLSEDEAVIIGETEWEEAEEDVALTDDFDLYAAETELTDPEETGLTAELSAEETEETAWDILLPGGFEETEGEAVAMTEITEAELNVDPGTDSALDSIFEEASAEEAAAEDRYAASGSCGEDISWTLDAGILTISGTGEMPMWHEDMWPHDDSIEEVTVESGVTSIGFDAFCSCTGLTTVNLPSGITSIGDYAFESCSSLTGIILPDSVSSMGSFVFWGCSSLEEFSLPANVTAIEEGAFSGCENLESVIIPSSSALKSIGENVFYGCGRLEEITIPAGVTGIGSSAFYGCKNLTEITLPAGLTSVGSAAFCECENLTDITLPSGLTDIEASLFDGCSSLENIVIPAGVKSLGACAFYGCTKLTDLVIPSGVKSIGESAFYGCEKLTGVTIPSGVTNIKASTFHGCENLENAVLPAGIISIGEGAFSGCWSITNFTLPENLTNIGGNAFYDCTGITEMIIPSKVRIIGDHAFCYCTGLVSITIPADVSSIGEGAFEECEKLTVYTSCASEAMTYAQENGIPFATDDTVPHTVNGWTVTKTSTCTLSGSKTGVCAVCGKTCTEAIQAAGHTAVTDPAKEAACTVSGLTEGTHCSTCNAVLVAQKTIAALGHYSDGGKITKAATCTASGIKTYTCVRCRTVLKTETIPAAGHKAVTDAAVAATCARTGLTAGSHCSVCNAVLKKQETVPVKAHTWGSWSVIAEATALKEGNRTRTCKVCGTKQVDKVAKLPAKLELAQRTVSVKKTKSLAVDAVISNGDIVTVETSSAKVATANYKDGKVIIQAGKKAGTATITVKTKTGKSAGITVKVPKVKTKKIKCKKLTVSLGKKKKLKPVITPSYSDDKVKFSVKNKKIASVSKTGVVKGKKIGSTTVNIKSGKKSVKVKISVVDLDTYNSIFSKLLGG